MTDNMKSFLAAVSKDEALNKEFKALADSVAKEADAQKSVIVELAAKHGFTLTEDDFKPSEMEEVSEDEMQAVAGGGKCACAFYGGGSGDGLVCVCTTGGEGVDGKHHLINDCKCACVIAGAGLN